MTSVLVGLVIVGSCPLGLGLAFYAGRTETAPGKWQLAKVDPQKLLDVCRGLMRDERKQGYYWNEKQRLDINFTGPECARGATEAAGYGTGWFPEQKESKPVGELPLPLSRLEPAAVAVTPSCVVLTWHTESYGYGYGLVIINEGADTTWFRQTDRHFRCNVELREGIWSYFLYH